jgi:peptidoglycan/xylan/chitin deacetylase (PgdA/CDA1 family)
MTDKKSDILRRAKAAGLFRLARARSAGAVRILCYHGLWLADDGFGGDSMFMAAATFRRRLEVIRRQGYPVVPLADAVRALSGRGPALPPASVVITIDDGWWSTCDGMLPALRAQGMPATLYCDTAQLLGGKPIAHVMARYLDIIAARRRNGGATPVDDASVEQARRRARDLTRPMDERLAGMYDLARCLGIDPRPYLDGRVFDYMRPDELARAHRDGLDIQLHTHRHTLGDMSAAFVANEIADNRRALGEILGGAPERFRHFCYPSGVASPAAADALSRLDLDSSTTTRQGLAWPGMPLHLLPRLLDGENLSEIEFEAELAGFGDWLRRGRQTVQRLTGTPPDPLSPAMLRRAPKVNAPAAMHGPLRNKA